MPRFTCTCQQCGTTFSSNREWQKFCTPPCQRAFHHDRYQSVAATKARVLELEAEVARLTALLESRHGR